MVLVSISARSSWLSPMLGIVHYFHSPTTNIDQILWFLYHFAFCGCQLFPNSLFMTKGEIIHTTWRLTVCLSNYGAAQHPRNSQFFFLVIGVIQIDSNNASNKPRSNNTPCLKSHCSPIPIQGWLGWPQMGMGNQWGLKRCGLLDLRLLLVLLRVICILPITGSKVVVFWDPDTLNGDGWITGPE